jgi:spore maturation protein CgeB
MNQLSILYLGARSGTSAHRVAALRRLGHRVLVVDPEALFPTNAAIGYWMHHAGGISLGGVARRRVLNAIGRGDFDLAFVNGGMLVDSALVEALKQRCGLVINYNNDDPFGKRDGGKWRLYLQALPVYDLVIVVRECNVSEARAAGARDVLRVYMSADEVAHSPRAVTKEDRDKWGSRVAFIGTWMPERGPFLARIAELGVPLAIFGDRWNKAREWTLLRPYWRGPNVADGDYAKAVRSADVCLGLLSKGNRDLSTTRSFEIPYLGGVLCAERTPEHLDLYRENIEAAFWSGPEECAEQCRRLMEDPQLRRSVSAAGRARCIANETLNEPTLQRLVHAATGKGLLQTQGFVTV